MSAHPTLTLIWLVGGFLQCGFMFWRVVDSLTRAWNTKCSCGEPAAVNRRVRRAAAVLVVYGVRLVFWFVLLPVEFVYLCLHPELLDK